MLGVAFGLGGVVLSMILTYGIALRRGAENLDREREQRGAEQKAEIDQLKAEIEKLEAAHRALKEPKFEVSCGKDIPGCYRETSFNFGGNVLPAAFYRMGVRAKCVNPIEGCFGRIILVTKDGVPKMDGESITVTFAPGNDDDATAKTITNQEMQFLDVLAITQNNQFLLPTRGFLNVIPPQNIFSETGKYLVTVTVSGKQTATVRAVLKFQWTGQWNNSALELLGAE
jgi:hypothetical protein